MNMRDTFTDKGPDGAYLRDDDGLDDGRLASAYVPQRLRRMTVSDLACAIAGAQQAIEAYDAMRDSPTDARVKQFRDSMNRLRALLGLGTDPLAAVSPERTSGPDNDEMCKCGHTLGATHLTPGTECLLFECKCGRFEASGPEGARP